MTSNKQITANQKNALLGGVKTEEGKAISRMNAVKHGILSQAVMLTEKEEAEKIYRKLYDTYDPQSPLEEILIERITIWTIRLRRAGKAEKDKWLNIFYPQKTRTIDEMPKIQLMIRDEVIDKGHQVKVHQEDIKNLDETYFRYENNLERNLYRAIHELQRLIAIRKGEKPQLPLAIDVTVDNATTEEKEE